MHRLEDLRAVAVSAVKAAGEVIVGWRADRSQLQTEAKGAGDYVTAADHAAEAAAIGVLRSCTPEIPVLAEESGGHEAERMWLLDPIDGTTNFLRGYPAVGVSLALTQDGRPVVGAVGAPLLGRSWSAVEGEGAHDQDGRRLSVGPVEGRGVVATGFPFRRPANLPRYLPVLEAALDEFEDLRRPGAASLDLAYCATGTWTGFFELGLAAWDIAAGSLLVLEAGGRVSDWQGDPRDVYRSGDIVAGAPDWHERMLELIRRGPARNRGAAVGL